MILKNKVALVTGASRGIGAAIALALGRSGSAVILNYQKGIGEPDRVVRDIRDSGGDAVAMQADLTKEEEVDSMIRSGSDRFGAIDILVNNYVSPIRFKRFSELDWEDIQYQIDGTIKAAFYCCKGVLSGMMENRWGRIINLNSTIIHKPVSGSHAYAVAKAAMAAFAKNLAIEYGQYGITVNTVSPGMTLTNEVSALDDGIRERQTKITPLRRLSTPEEVAAVVLFFASPWSDMVTGSYLPVDGGCALP
jgi:3-oxoacyl-[acyl-carrier protein] reductase